MNEAFDAGVVAGRPHAAEDSPLPPRNSLLSKRTTKSASAKNGQVGQVARGGVLTSSTALRAAPHARRAAANEPAPKVVSQPRGVDSQTTEVKQHRIRWR